MTLIVVIELRTEQCTEIPRIVGTQLSCEVGCEEVIEDIVLNTIVFNLTTSILCRTLFRYITIVSGVNIKTSLLTDYQVVTLCIPAEVRTILKISITEYTVGMLLEFIVILPPIWVVE